MEVKEFIRGTQDYYGLEYRKGIHLNTIATYLSEKSEFMLGCLFSAIILEFSGQYKTLPDVAALEKAKDRMYEIYNERMKKQDKMVPAIEEAQLEDYRDEVLAMFKNLTSKVKWHHKIKEGDK